jgi:hypothetical protein
MATVATASVEQAASAQTDATQNVLQLNARSAGDAQLQNAVTAEASKLLKPDASEYTKGAHDGK